jgi:hypothetical protein
MPGKKKVVERWKLTNSVILPIMHNANNENLYTSKTSYFSKHFFF